MEKKIIFLDIDGTLTIPGENEPPRSALDAISRARENGHLVFICTGRNYQMMSPLLKYEFDGFVASSGGYIQCGDKILSDCPMTEEQKQRVLEVFKRNDVLRTLECFDGTYIDDGLENMLSGDGKSNSEFMRLRRQIERTLDIRPMSEYLNQPIYKIVFMCNEMKQLDEPRRELDDEFYFSIQEKNEHGIINGELVNRSFNKGKAVRTVCDYLQIPISSSIGFGDSMNDIEMFNAVNYSVCMANGCEQLRDMADYICPTVEQNGIQLAFEKIGII